MAMCRPASAQSHGCRIARVQVSVPCSSLLKVVAVQCGHCAGLLSVSLSSQQAPPAVSVELPLQVIPGFLSSLSMGIM